MAYFRGYVSFREGTGLLWYMPHQSRFMSVGMRFYDNSTRNLAKRVPWKSGGKSSNELCQVWNIYISPEPFLYHVLSQKTSTYPWSIPGIPKPPQMIQEFRNINRWVGGLGYVPGVCWKILTNVFQIFFIFTPTWGNDPIWLIFLRWVETTNQLRF